MASEEELERKVHHILKGAGKKTGEKGDTRMVRKPSKSNNVDQRVSGDSNVVAGHDIYLNTKPPRPKVTVIASGDNISPSQKRTIQELIQEIVDTEITAGKYASRSQGYPVWYSKLKKKFKVNQYALLHKDQYDSVIKWLSQQRAMLRPGLRRKNNDAWRSSLYRGIWARSKELGLEKSRVYEVASDIAGDRISSLKELGERNLKKLYDRIFSFRVV